MNATVHIIALVLSTLLYISNSESCGSRDDTKPQLRITIADVDYAGTDKANYMWVRVLYGKNIRKAVWSDWQDLDTAGCDDLDRGQTDYFDLDLLGSTEQWLAIAFYTTTSDGMLVDSLGYWDGSAPQHLDHFCGSIAGPSEGDLCFNGEDTTGSYCENPITSDPSYDAFWVDNADDVHENCFVSINLNAKRGVGSAFSVSDPGTPADPTGSLHSLESCGSQDDTKPQLRITIADVSNAGTDEADEMFVRVLYGKNIKNAVWSDWQDLDTAGCDDLDRGQTDYFDLDLSGSTEQWLAISFYSTSGDGMVVDSLGYWDGTAPQHLDHFCGLIGGPFYSDSCFEDADTTNSLCDNPVSTE
eukprot:670229_1